MDNVFSRLIYMAMRDENIAFAEAVGYDELADALKTAGAIEKRHLGHSIIVRDFGWMMTIGF